MTAARPCDCNSFVPGHPFRPGVDCTPCWLYSHRPEMRAAWGGDPKECLPVFAIEPSMSVEALTVLLAGPPVAMPEGWKHWPVAREAHLLLAERFIAEMPAYPEGRFSGRGAVICGGGKYEASVYVACRMLRLVGWEHPIQVWHRGAEEPVSDRVRRLPGVEVVDIEAHPARAARRVMGGWQAKNFAIIHSPFEEVLYIDADCYPIFNPDECFEPNHNPFGIVTWPDMPAEDNAVHWPTYEVDPDGLSLNGGHYVLCKRSAWRAWQLAAHFDNHSDYYYWWNTFGVEVGGFGDQEQLRVALRRLNVPHHQYANRPEFSGGAFLQAGPGGRLLFIHRVNNKFDLTGAFPHPTSWRPDALPMESTVWGFYLEWLNGREGRGAAENEVPGMITNDEFAAWRRHCTGRNVLELGRHLGRSTVAAAQTAKRVVSLDRFSGKDADTWLQRYGVRHKVWLREGEFAELVPTSGRGFTACLIDGAHERAKVEADIATVLPHLAPGAIIGFHDYADPAFPDVTAVVDEAAEKYGWRMIDRADYLAVFQTP